MECPMITGVVVRFCSAVKGMVALSEGELTTYCLNNNHRNCPIQKMSLKIGRKLEFESYLEIYYGNSSHDQAA